VSTGAKRTPAERAADVGAQALSAAALIPKVAQDTAGRVATGISKTLDKATELAHSASPLKGRKKK